MVHLVEICDTEYSLMSNQTGYSTIKCTTNSASSDEAAAVAGTHERVLLDDESDMDHKRVNKFSVNLDDDETDSSGSDDDPAAQDRVEEVREGREVCLQCDTEYSLLSNQTGYSTIKCTTNSASSDEAAAVAGTHERVQSDDESDMDHKWVKNNSINLDDDETDSSGSDDDSSSDDDSITAQVRVVEVGKGREFNLFLKKLLEDPYNYKAYIGDLKKEHPEIKKLIFKEHLGLPLRDAMRLCISAVSACGLTLAERRDMVAQSEEFKEFKEMMHKEPNKEKAHCKKFKENNPFGHMMFFEDSCFSLYDAYPHPDYSRGSALLIQGIMAGLQKQERLDESWWEGLPTDSYKEESETTGYSRETS